MLKSLRQRLNRNSAGRINLFDRTVLANMYIQGSGIEVGALHNPLPVKKATVRYVDRMSEKDLRVHYSELKDKPLVHVDFIADGELLQPVPDNSQDFVIANHFIEHCQDTILTLKNMVRVLNPGGIVFLAVPDKRFTFDKGRNSTTLSHLITDYEQGAAVSRKQHFYEWTKNLNTGKNETEIAEEAMKIMALDYSIHFHVWEKKDMDELLLHLVKNMNFPFEVELALRITGSNENIYILRKNS